MKYFLNILQTSFYKQIISLNRKIKKQNYLNFEFFNF